VFDSQGAGQLFTINLATGAATFVGMVGGTGAVSGLAAAALDTAPPHSTVGVFDPSSATWYLRTHNSAGPLDIAPFQYGGVGWLAVTGDWNGDGRDTPGVVDPTATADPNNLVWYVRNSNTAGLAELSPFSFGACGWVPLAGDWQGLGHSGIGVFD